MEVADAALGGLVYGVATSELEGCQAVFGVPLALVGGGLLFALVRHGRPPPQKMI